MTKFFVDGAGKYLGGFDGTAPPKGAIEIPSPPADARQVWDGQKFGAKPPDRAKPVLPPSSANAVPALRDDHNALVAELKALGVLES